MEPSLGFGLDGHELFDFEQFIGAACHRAKDQMADHHHPASKGKEPGEEKGKRVKVDKVERQAQHRLGKEDRQQRNIKTGRGGMVDVEFLAQYLQLRYGQANHALRCRNTLDALLALHQEGLLAEEEYSSLVSGYKFLRRMENKLRLVHDQSINKLDADPEYLTKLARHLGYPEQPVRPGQALVDFYN